jgi:hypothetical protein
LQLKAKFEKSTENSVQEAMAEYKTFNQLPETTPDEIERKAKAYKKFIDGKGFTFLKAMADTQVAQFFISKTEANKDYLMTDADFRLILSGYKGWQDKKVAKATAVALEQRFFHWFIEFPEVFDEGGFDCILGNPPFLGGKRISTYFGDSYLNFIKDNYAPIKGATCDLVAYFFRRDFALIKVDRFVSLISTNTIAQGETREGSLDFICNKGQIVFAVKSMKWPGLAAVEVSLVAFNSGKSFDDIILNNKKVGFISPYLDDIEQKGNPFKLLENENKSFKGSYVLGLGFMLSPEEAEKILTSNPAYSKVLSPYLIGDDLNTSINQSPSRWVINFYDWQKDKAEKEYPICFERIQRLVFPERQLLKDKGYRNKWWQYARRGVELYNQIQKNNIVFSSSTVTKYLNYTCQKSNLIFDITTNVVSYDQFTYFSILQSSIHNEWAWKNCSSMGISLRYTPTDGIQTYPFPQNRNLQQEQQLETIGEAYHEHRKQLMLGMQLGLTKTYNLFHSNAITAQSINEKDKQVASLEKHLEKTANTISFDEAIQGILKLRELHVQMDTAVLDAYGWNNIELKHDFYEVDYLPENDRVRFTIHPDARKEVLKRLLGLNHKIHEEEVRKGLWDKKGNKTKNYNSQEDLSEVNEDVVDFGLFKQ